MLILALASAAAAAVTTAPASAEATGPVLAAPATAHSSHGRLPVPVPVVDWTGVWAEQVDPTRPGVTRYVARLELLRDGRFTWLNNYLCNAKQHPQFKIAMNSGTYKIDGEKVTFDGDLFDATGKADLLAPHKMVLNGRTEVIREQSF
ncbi:hypothetical protein ACIQV3_32585 [Streptomyces sp. NPDC099050]|uniref:hypothetical protein n=1 Tax=Streptomyces sp. NPDC099050 TaxID=3366100 RepID=UPI003815FEBF